MIPLKVVEPRVISAECEMMMVVLWRQGNDTMEIAALLSLPEFEVANRLPLLRQHHQLRSDCSPA